MVRRSRCPLAVNLWCSAAAVVAARRRSSVRPVRSPPFGLPSASCVFRTTHATWPAFTSDAGAVDAQRGVLIDPARSCGARRRTADSEEER